MKKMIIGCLCLIALLGSSCSSLATPTQKQQSSTPSSSKPESESTNQPENVSDPKKTAPLIQSTSTPIATPSPTLLSSCPPVDGVNWSQFFAPDTSFISSILPAEEGAYYVSGVLDDVNGTWIAKINADGEILWQNVYGTNMASVTPAQNGNLLLEFGLTNLEIDSNGTIVRGLDVPWYEPNADGSFTISSGNQIVRFTDPQTPLWQHTLQNPEAYFTKTRDGGGIYAYAGTYADESVYYRPIYTDIKVIKIDGNGKVWQRVYGKLVGDETLSLLQPTSYGGAILGGTHAYEELGIDYDVWLMKLNNTGSLSWQTTFKFAPDMENLDEFYFLKNGYAAVISSDYGDTKTLVKLNKNGSLAWQKQISSSRGWITVIAIADTPDGGIIFSAETNEANYVSFLARLGPKGDLLWEKTLGFNQIADAPDTFVQTILPLENGEILLGGGTNLAGTDPTTIYSAWMAKINDAGEITGLLTLAPGKFNVGNTLSSRPNTLKDEISDTSDLVVKEFAVPVDNTPFQILPACMLPGAQFPTPVALPSITPSITPTPAFQRDLYLNDPAMAGDDVLLLQQRLLELGYTEVGTPDGSFGAMTNNAVRLFQEINQMDVDGYVGPLTWTELFDQNAIAK